MVIDSGMFMNFPLKMLMFHSYVNVYQRVPVSTRISQSHDLKTSAETWRVCGESPKFALYLRPMDFQCLCAAQAEDAPDMPQVNKKQLHMNHLQIRLPSKSDNADSDTTTQNPLNIKVN